MARSVSVCDMVTTNYISIACPPIFSLRYFKHQYLLFLAELIDFHLTLILLLYIVHDINQHNTRVS
jgi:hypothetical protein